MRVEDGSGTGRTVFVNKENKLLVEAETITHLMAHTRLGETFYIATDFIALTSTGVFNGLLYVRNDGERLLEIHSIRLSGSVLHRAKLIKNPTTGTLISAGAAATPENLNTQSAAAFLGTTKKAASDGQTVTDGVHWSQAVLAAGATNFEFNGAMVIGPGDSFAVVTKPSASGDFGVTVLVAYAHEGS